MRSTEKYIRKLTRRRGTSRQPVDVDRMIRLTKKSKRKVLAFAKQIKEPLRDDEEIGRVEIIVLTFKSPHNEVECIKRIIEKTRHPYQITVFDNRPNSPNTSKVWNKLIWDSTCPFIVIMDSDAFVETEGWIEKMFTVLVSRPDCGVVVPVCGRNGSCPEFQRLSASNRAPHAVDRYVSGYCFMFRKALVSEIGWFDEDFLMYGQDSDWFDRLKYRGYKAYIHPQVEVFHLGMSEAKKADKEGVFDLELDMKHAEILFNKKKDRRWKEGRLLEEDIGEVK